NLDVNEMDELHKDIRYYLRLEKHEQNKKFWQALLVVCDDELERLRAPAQHVDPRAAGRGTASAVVESDVQSLLAGKTIVQLDSLQSQIQRKLASNEPVDVEYWERVLRALTVAKAKAKLDDIHQDMLMKRLERLRELQRHQAEQSRMEIEQSLEAQHGLRHEPDALLQQAREEVAMEIDEAEATQAMPVEPYTRAMSPVPWDTVPRADRELPVVDAEEDMQTLLKQREEVRQRKFVPKPMAPIPSQEITSNDDLAAEMYRIEASRGMDEDEEVFDIEETLASTTYMWQDKYRPRRPRYFNRVHTGYEWNKYNQTHYDHDNPPPKVVQGYKFNIFYPDLIDKTKAPSYRIEKEPGNDETVMLRFTAGPPYEDIAFRIVNRSWEYSHKKGFRSKFDRGVLQLHFRFKRHFYRR
ncbi:cactus-binding C-terminus of cactin protein-domain-containing protein, partial [Thamnocephalis sphaerospora]